MKPDVQINVFAEQDDIPVRGNALASGDDAVDKEAEDEILQRLDQGDVWAWAFVTVKATCECCGAIGTDSLGACSYANEKDFVNADYYYVDMCMAATEAMRLECICGEPTATCAIPPATCEGGAS